MTAEPAHLFGFAPARIVPALVFAASVGALAIAYTAQFAFGLEPCELCLWQRVPYAVAALLALGALRLPGTPWPRRLMVLAGLAFLAGAGIATYHFGVEQHWWQSACTGSIADITSTADLLASLSGPPPKACDAVDWTVFGVSITVYNAVISAALAAFAIAGALRIRTAD